jgi:hypothetical protein
VPPFERQIRHTPSVSTQRSNRGHFGVMLIASSFL